MNIDLIFRIAAIGILTAVLNQVLSKAGKDDMATMASLAGIIIVLAMILEQVFNLFSTMRSLFSLY